MAAHSPSLRAFVKRVTPPRLLHVLGRAAGADRRGYRRITSLGADSPNPWIRKSSQIGGWLFEGEHEFLWELAASRSDGHVLEIGTWMGKSACIFSGACQEHAPETRVFCVDPFTMLGSPLQMSYHRRLMGRGKTGTFYEFQANARMLGFDQWVVPITTTSELALPPLPAFFRLAFIDGGHGYEEARRDVELVLAKLLTGGTVALHDENRYEGVAQLVRELREDRRVRFIRQVNSIAAFEKL